jgi:acetyl esterase
MPLHPHAQEILRQFNERYSQIQEPVTLKARRAMVETALRSPGPTVERVKYLRAPGPGGDMPVRVYTPRGAGPFGALVWYHGGGWVIGSIDMADGTARHLAVAADCAVVSVGYRLAPEAKFPAPAEDCYAAAKWTHANAATLGVDPSKIAVGGDSAGGNLAAAVALMARDRRGPPLAFQLLIYPVIDRDFQTRSYLDNAKGYLLTREGMVSNWEMYLSSEADAANPYAAPLQAKDFRRLPPALVVTAEFDPLRDEGEAYARRLIEAGVPATSTRYDGMVHGFLSYQEVADAGRRAMAESAAALRAAFAGTWRPGPPRHAP